MDFYSGEKIAGREIIVDTPCKCGALPQLVHRMMDSTRGLTVRMFECRCGERRWSEAKE